MKLSDAIAKGRALIPDRVFGTFFCFDRTGKEIMAACDLGCAAHTLSQTTSGVIQFTSNRLGSEWPELLGEPTEELPIEDDECLFEQITRESDYGSLTTEEVVAALRGAGY